MNVWDNGYPSGGNYWSDYIGTNLYSGPYQNHTGSDGMGDMPYVIDALNVDRYPFINETGWKYLTPEQAISDLISIVQQMNLQRGIANGLDAKLTNVLASLEALNAEQRNDTINKLYAFINEVEARYYSYWLMFYENGNVDVIDALTGEKDKDLMVEEVLESISR